MRSGLKGLGLSCILLGNGVVGGTKSFDLLRRGSSPLFLRWRFSRGGIFTIMSRVWA